MIREWLDNLAELPRRFADAMTVPLLPDIAEGILASPALAPAGAGDGRLCNSGGPRTRTRTEPIRRSIFGPGDRCRLGARPVGGVYALFLGLVDNAAIAVGFRDAAHDALQACGFENPEAAFEAFTDLPRRRLHSRGVEPPDPSLLAMCLPEDREHFLKTALVLGKCSQGLYDPSRPVIWTENRLGQSVRLYEIGERFYEGTEE